jgi:PadR family transcriptional regulator PadR
MCRRCGCLRTSKDATPRGAPVQGILEAAVLVACAEAPRYGYEIATWLTAEGLVSAPVSPGRLYETIGTLSRAGALVGVDEESDKGPSRRRYHLTETGRERLAAWAVSLERTGATLARLLSRMAALSDAGPDPTAHDPTAHDPTDHVPAEGGETMPCQCHCGGPGARNAEPPTTATAPASAPQPAPARTVEERLEHVEALLERLVSR